MANATLEEFSAQFSELLSQNKAWTEFLPPARQLVSKLLAEPDWLKPILSKLILDKDFLNSQWHSIDPNDIQLFRSPDKSFSIRAFIWEPGVTYPIHDHGAWGIVAAHTNQIRERKFARLDDQNITGYAEIKEVSNAVLNPGETTYVLPLDKGIHQMEAVDNRASITIHIYGSPVRKGYIQYFDLAQRRTQRVYPPQTVHKLLAIKALGSIPDSWAKNLLLSALNSEPDYVKEECEISLTKIDSIKSQK